MVALSHFTNDEDDRIPSMAAVQQRLTHQRRPTEKQQQQLEEQEEAEHHHIARSKAARAHRQVDLDDEDDEDKLDENSNPFDNVTDSVAGFDEDNMFLSRIILPKVKKTVLKARTTLVPPLMKAGRLPATNVVLRTLPRPTSEQPGFVLGNSTNTHISTKDYFHDPDDSNEEHERCEVTPGSLSDQPVSKRQHEEDSEPSDSDEEAVHKAQRDFDDDTQEVLHYAIGFYRSKISTCFAFPDHATELDWAKESWAEAQELTELDVPLTITLVGMITHRGLHVCSKLKTKVCLLVETIYGFSSGQNRKITENNHNTVVALKDESGFVYQVLHANKLQRKGLYKNDIIQKPLPVPAITLVLTAIECRIDKWGTGIKTDIAFTGAEYKRVYEAHVESLQNFGQHTIHYSLLDKLQNKLSTEGHFYSSAQPLGAIPGVAIPYSAFDATIREYEDEESVTEDDIEDVIHPTGQGFEV
ncbi:hypothetical protein JAAARDRAFT_61153 [Jaapia argillacea MUCL 33604]|uniref:DUF6532 domain-containing protein n=1 Tax=Jaapia argillacea MUCL 33604 TaxID=933084 RepID=A0A067PR44_9AGAM|nr:hypothetical protein JAAARDRAFT_61153 [Jaapia argillacea MUCL 33604]